MTDSPHIDVGDMVAYHPSNPKENFWSRGRIIQPKDGDVGVVKSIHHLVGHMPYVVVECFRTGALYGSLEENFTLLSKPPITDD